MVHIIYGRTHSGCEEAFLDKIKTSAENSEIKTLVIVPDQYSFEFDKKLYEHLGAKLFNSVETNGISRLCEQLCRTLGGVGLDAADDNTKCIAMYKAQASLRREGFDGYHKKSLLKPYFVSECITLFSQLARAGTTTEVIRLAAESSPAASQKLQSIAVIYERYNITLKEMGFKDSLSDTAIAARLADENKFFKDADVFFTAFSDFSLDELKLVDKVVAQAKNSVFSLIADNKPKNSQNIFARTIRTLSSIERLANDHNQKPKLTLCTDCTQTIALNHINRQYGSYSPVRADSEGMVKVVSASDIYEESEYICAEINRLAREENYSYKDIAVLCANISETALVFGSAAERYDIPYFIDHSKSALTSVPAKYLKSVLNSVTTREYRTENILRIVKSPLSPVLEYDACDLEDYCTIWNVEGKMWNEPFMISKGKSDRVEQTRQRIITPLNKFKAACTDKTAGEICKALFTLLDELNMSEKVYSAVKLAANENDTDLEISRSLKQVWLQMTEAIKCIYDSMGNEQISLHAFSELVTLLLSRLKISAPPQKADCVRVGQTEHSRLSGVKVLFIMQVNEGIFPIGARLGGILSENELKALSEQGAILDNLPSIQLDNERFEVYSALTLPTERLYTTYSETNRKGEHTNRSPLIKQIIGLFSDDVFLRAGELDREFFCTSHKTAFYEYLGHTKDNTLSQANITASLNASPYYSKLIEEIDRASHSVSGNLTPSTAKELFFPFDTFLSATKVSDYYSCPFAYYCKHGLKLYIPQAVEINSMNIGNIVHSCLENVMSRFENGKRVYDEKFPTLEDEELERRISVAVNAYVEESMGGDYGKSKRFYFELEGLRRAILMMAINFREEMKHSQFIPVAFEYNLTDKNGDSMLVVKLDDGVELKLQGQIDRADIFKNDKGSWIRIIDYKTGDQRFKKEEVYHGLDLQMLLYLLAATSADSRLSEKKLFPAGIMYSHVTLLSSKYPPDQIKESEENGTLEKFIAGKHTLAYHPDGVMLWDEIKDGLNVSEKGVYTIFKFNTDRSFSKDSAVPSTVEDLKAMETFALNKLIDMANNLSRGIIPPEPIRRKKDRTSCTHCEYKKHCKNPNPLIMKEVTPEDADLLDKELEIIKGNSQQ